MQNTPEIAIRGLPFKIYFRRLNPNSPIHKAEYQVGVHGATWEFQDSDPEIFAPDFEENPIKAARDIGGDPPETSGNALPNPEIID